METHWWIGFTCAAVLVGVVGGFSWIVNQAASREKQK
jgi:hypothetical protein